MNAEIPNTSLAPTPITASHDEQVPPFTDEMSRKLAPLLLPDYVPSEALVAAINADKAHRPEAADAVNQHFRLGSLFLDLAQSLSSAASEKASAYFVEQAFDHLEGAAGAEGTSKAKLDATFLLAYGDAFRFRWELQVPKNVMSRVAENLVQMTEAPQFLSEDPRARSMGLNRVGVHLLDTLHGTLTLPAGAREMVVLRRMNKAAKTFRHEAHSMYIIDRQNDCKLPHRNTLSRNKMVGDTVITANFSDIAYLAMDKVMSGEIRSQAQAGRLAFEWLCERAGGVVLDRDQREVIAFMRHRLQLKRHHWRMRNIQA